MKSMMQRRFLLFLGLVLVLSARSATAHEGHVHTAMGTVAGVTAESLDVKVTDGKTELFSLTAETKLERAGKSEVWSKISPGERVVVHYKEVGGKNVAQHVQLAAKDDGR
jgi:hypothetical protein